MSRSRRLTCEDWASGWLASFPGGEDVPRYQGRKTILDLDLKALVSDAGRLVERFGDEAIFAALCLRSGMITPQLPHRTAQMLLGRSVRRCSREYAAFIADQRSRRFVVAEVFASQILGQQQLILNFTR